MKGYFGIGVDNIKTEMNLGTLLRSAVNLHSSFVFTIHKRYKISSCDTIKAYNHIPLIHYENAEIFKQSIPYDCIPVGIEISDNAKNIVGFIHPKNAIYILGAEDSGLSKGISDLCKHIIYIPTNYCLNVAVAGAIVMYDRLLKAEGLRWKEMQRLKV